MCLYVVPLSPVCQGRLHEQCLVLGQALLQDDSLDSQLRAYDEEKQLTEERFRNGTGAMVMLHIQKSAGESDMRAGTRSSPPTCSM